MDYIIIMALCEKLRHWRYLCDKDVSIAGDYWNKQIMGELFFQAFYLLCPGDLSFTKYEREYTELVESMLQTDLNKFNRSFFASEYVIED